MSSQILIAIPPKGVDSFRRSVFRDGVRGETMVFVKNETYPMSEFTPDQLNALRQDMGNALICVELDEKGKLRLSEEGMRMFREGLFEPVVAASAVEEPGTVEPPAAEEPVAEAKATHSEPEDGIGFNPDDHGKGRKNRR